MKRVTGVIIGLDIEVEGSHLKGKVINETKNTITIKTQRGDKKVIKKNHAFTINGAKVPGEQLLGRIEERIKS
jgi:RNase P/RNase MRP subunit p29